MWEEEKKVSRWVRNSSPHTMADLPALLLFPSPIPPVLVPRRPSPPSCPSCRYAEGLPQLDAGRKISPNPKEWRCEETGATENLWLNLSTGVIGSGRKV